MVHFAPESLVHFTPELLVHFTPELVVHYRPEYTLEPPLQSFTGRAAPLVNENEDRPLTLSTIHSAKGLEWHTVFIPHALDGMIPSSFAVKSLEGVEEERRLFYVACSRAQENLFITMPSHISAAGGFFSYPSQAGF